MDTNLLIILLQGFHQNRETMTDFMIGYQEGC